jgi:hypothetical protein
MCGTMPMEAEVSIQFLTSTLDSKVFPWDFGTQTANYRRCLTTTMSRHEYVMRGEGQQDAMDSTRCARARWGVNGTS